MTQIQKPRKLFIIYSNFCLDQGRKTWEIWKLKGGDEWLFRVCTGADFECILAFTQNILFLHP